LGRPDFSYSHYVGAIVGSVRLSQFLASVVIYASVLFWILVWRIRYPHEYYVGQKYDNPGVILVFLGIISAAIVLVRATIFLVMFIWRVLKSNRASRGA